MTLRKYSGSCHCGAVQYDVEVDLDNVNTCNCSRCSRLGVIWSFAQPEKFNLTKGADALASYLFNRKVINHRFCTTCGIEPFARGTLTRGVEMVAVNVRCLEGRPRCSETTRV
jgi:hypothetical protein